MVNNIAIIMSVYKSDDVLAFRYSINSLLNQTIPCHIFLYRDGCVSSEMQAFLNELKCCQEITIIENNSNLGLAYGLNVLIEHALNNGFRYIARMDSDDVSLPDRIESQINYFSSNPDVDVCGGFCKEFGASYSLDIKKLPLKHEELIQFSIVRCPFIHPTVMFRADVFYSGIRYPVDTYFCEDLALWYILLSAGYKFGNLNKVLLHYRMTEDTLSRRKGFRKGISEVKLRLKYMFRLNKITIRNTFFILSRVFFHITPSFLMRFAYKYLR